VEVAPRLLVVRGMAQLNNYAYCFPFLSKKTRKMDPPRDQAPAVVCSK